MHRWMGWGALVVLLASAQTGWTQGALERLEKRLQKPAAPRPAAEGATEELGYLGAITDDRQDRGRGVRVLEIVKDGPADAGGLQVDDLITAIGDQPIRRMTDMAEVMESSRPGQQLTLEVQRGKETQTVRIRLARRPADRPLRVDDQPPRNVEDPQPAGRGVVNTGRGRRLGMTVRSIDDATAQQLGLPAGTGMVVSEVVIGSPAHAAGVRAGSILASVNGQPAESVEQIAALVQTSAPGRDLTFVLFENNRRREVKVRIPGNEELPEPADETGVDLRTPAGPIVGPEEPLLGPQPAGGIDTLLRGILDRLERMEQRLEALEQRLPPAADEPEAEAP